LYAALKYFKQKSRPIDVMQSLGQLSGTFLHVPTISEMSK